MRTKKQPECQSSDKALARRSYLPNFYDVLSHIMLKVYTYICIIYFYKKDRPFNIVMYEKACA